MNISKWRFAKVDEENMSFLSLGSAKTRAYVNPSMTIFVKTNDFMPFPDHVVRFMILCHRQSDVVKFELAHSIESLDSKERSWRPVGENVYRILFGEDVMGMFNPTLFPDFIFWSGTWDRDGGVARMNVERQDGRVLLSCRRRPLVEKYMKDLSAPRIGLSPIADLLDCVGLGRFAFAALFSDHLRNIHDVDAVMTAIDSIPLLKSVIQHGWHDALIESLQKEMKARHEQMKKLDDCIMKTYEDSADAMNMMSEKWGIEISL